MNEMINFNTQEATMTTNEIAELTGKRHDNVLMDTQKMLTELYGEKDALRFKGIYHDAYNREKPCYNLPKNEVLVLVSGYSIKLRMKIITRMEELEKQSKDPMAFLNDPAAMRGVLLTYTEKVIALQKENQVLVPKAEALDLITNADGENCITDTAKVLQVRPKDLFNWLSSEHWIYRRAGGKNWIAYQDKIQQGFLTHKVTTVTDINTGIPKMVEHVLVTARGLTELSKKINADSPKSDRPIASHLTWSPLN